MFGNDNQQQDNSGQNWQQPADQSQVVQPSEDNQTPQAVTAPSVPAQAQNDNGAQDWQQPTPQAPSAPDEPASAAQSTNDLIDIKQQALQQLSPIVGHLEQTPEEKFKTTMMMIQASDNQALVPDAYAAAQLITDDKAKAQALLDIINEINYFTQK